MKSKDKSAEGNKRQIDRFKEAARALDCDDDEAAFDEKLKRIAEQQPHPDAKSAGLAPPLPKRN